MTKMKTAKRNKALHITRRKFLSRTAKVSGIISVPWIIPSTIWGANRNLTPSERITVGLIGKGIMGSGHLHRLVGDREVQVLAVCDVDRLRREDGKRLVEETYAADRSKGTYHGCTVYNDYRELIDKEQPDILSITTRPEQHAEHMIYGANHGVKGMYAEKPLCCSLVETDAIREAFERNGVFLQYGPMPASG